MKLSEFQKKAFGIPTAGLSALFILLVVATLSYRSIHQLVEGIHTKSQAYQRITLIESLYSLMKDSQRGMRGYVITGEVRYLQPHFVAAESVWKQLAELRRLVMDRPGQLKRLQQVRQLVEEEFKVHQETIATQARQGLEAARAIVQAGRGKQIMDELQEAIEEMKRDEIDSLNQGAQMVEAHVQRTTLALVVGTLIIFGLLLSAYSLVERKILQFRESEQKADSLNLALQDRNRDISLLNETGEMLQSCQNSQEAYSVIRHSVEKLLLVNSGALFLVKESRNYLENAAVFGDGFDGELVFPPESCWALRRGHPHAMGGSHETPNCGHLRLSDPSVAICIPLMAQGETLGVLTLVDRPSATGSKTLESIESRQKLALGLTESVALSLANIKLREALRNQSIVDPLTSLFNRRYMEETLERELRRAERKQLPLGLVMMDLDYFKRFNDTFGHEAGDLLLKEFAQFVQSRIRKEDIFCRFGGEEFVLIFPETTMEDTWKRAEQIREAMRHLHVVHQGRSLGAVTVSVGVSAFPEHGFSKSLIQVADAALYRAKGQGRDQVVIGEAESIQRDANFLRKG